MIQLDADDDDAVDRAVDCAVNERVTKRARIARSASTDSEDVEEDRIIYRFHDTLGHDHWVVRYPKTIGRSGKRYTKARRCITCSKHTCCYCFQCNIPLCYCISRGEAGNGSRHERECFKHHIKEHARKSRRITNENVSTVSELVH